MPSAEDSIQPHVPLHREQPDEERADQLTLKGQLLAAVEDEKHRIARELHDGLGQELTSAIFLLDMCAANLDPRSRETAAKLQELRATLLECVESLRGMYLKLRPPMLEDLGLVPTLNWFFRQSRLQDKVTLKFELIGMEQPLHPDVETALFRIIQEATNNIMKHSHATNVEVRLEATDGESVRLTVADNGIGLDPEEAMSTHSCRFSMGMRGMKERVDVLHGQFEVKSRPGSGTKVLVSLPLVMRDRREP